MPRLEIALLGPPEITLDGNPVKTDRRKAIALLAYLAVTAKPQPRDALAALLWPDYGRDSAYAYLRRTLWELNQILGSGWIEADRDWVQLSAGTDLNLDTAQFEQHCGRTGPEEAPDHLETAIRLYRADFMAGFIIADTVPFEDWQSQQARHFRQVFASGLERLVEARAAAGEHGLALPHARRWLSLDPLDESAHRALMRLYAGIGDRTGAIRQYEACVQVLKDELGIPPQPETEELYRAVLRGEILGVRQSSEDARQAKPVLSKTERPASRLPQMPTPFIGRRPEVEQVKSLLLNPAHRLITLVGPGGTGKTRLSLQAASEVEAAFPDGVWFVSLAPVQSPEAVLPAVARALNFSFYREQETPRQQLLDFLREKQLLLILDNFEHLLACSDLVLDILAYAAEVKLMVTSRVRLNMQAEQLFAVAGMRMPGTAEARAWSDPEAQAKPFSAVQLFVERASRVQPGFRLTLENAQPVLEICRLVHGMPLGLELAAAWLELLTPEEIAAEITRSLDFLETDQADVPDRQRSIRAVFESSWKLLTDDEREAFVKLCVFVGSFSREAGQQVSGASLKTLLGLANKSWLQQTHDGKFQLHELMRQYGNERLQANAVAWQEAKNSHADYFAGYVAAQSLKMSGPEQRAGFEAIEEEFETNIKAAWDWLVAQRRWDDIIHRMILGLFQFGTVFWKSDDMIAWLREARIALESDPKHQERMTYYAIIGMLEVYCEETGGIKDADPIKRLTAIWEIVTKNGLDEEMDFWFMPLAGLRRARNPAPSLELDELYDKAVTRFRQQNRLWELGISLLIQANWWSLYSYDENKLFEALKIFREIGVIHEQGVVFQLLGRHAFQQKRPPAEIANYFQQAKKFDEQLGSKSQSSIDWINLAGIYFQQGDPEQGFALLQETQRTYERVGNMRLLVGSLNWEGLYAVRYSTINHALQVRTRSLELARKLGNQSDLSWHLYELGDAYRVAGHLETAREYYEQAHTNFRKMNLNLGLSYYQRGMGDIALQEKRFADALTCYREFMRYAVQDNHQWSIGQAHGRLALALAYLGNREESRRETYTDLSEMRHWGENDLVLYSLLAESVCLVQEKNLDEAVELTTFIIHHPVSWNETKRIARTILEMASSGLSEEAVQLCIERGKGLTLDSVVAALIERLAVGQRPIPK